ncbi:MAG: DUF4175 family protein [Verrucomicrobiota bacterium]|nr:DUF4175 family protein [Verrucomicrobiota bacterium]
MKPNPIHSTLLNRLQGLARWKRLSIRVRIPAMGLAGVILLALCWGGADWLFVLKDGLRAFGFIMIVGLLTYMTWCWVSVMRRRVDDKEAALDAEGINPSFSTVVSTTAEYEQNPGRTSQDHVAKDWVKIMQVRAGEMLARYRPPYVKQLGIAGFVFGCAFVALILYMTLLPEGLISLARIIPGTKLSYTRIGMMTDAVKVPKGSPYLIQTEITGRKPEAVILHYKPQGTDLFQQIIMDEIQPGIFSYEIPLVEKSFDYYLTAADGEMPVQNVQAFEPPRIDEFIIRVTPPAYTGQAPYTLAAPDVSVLRGSGVDYRIKTSPRLNHVIQMREKLEFPEEGQVVSLGRFDQKFFADGDQYWWTAWTSDKPAEFAYAIILTDHLDQTVTNSAPYRFSFAADRVPKVEITEPGKDIAANPNMKIQVKATAKDDYEIVKMRLIYNKLGDAPRTNNLQNISKEGSKWMVSGEIELEPLGLKPYELVAYFVEAEDNNTLDGPGIGKSQTYFIEITNEKVALYQSKGSSQSSIETINLLEAQKNIISTANQLIERKEEKKAENLSVSQKVIREYTEVYLDAMKKTKLPESVLEMMSEAIEYMKASEEKLQSGNIQEAMVPAQKALANLYQVVQLTPGKRPSVMGEADDDQNVAILLEAIHQYGKAKNKKVQKALREIIDEAKQLAELETEISTKRHPLPKFKGGKKGSGNGKGNGLTNQERELKERGEQLAAKIKALSEKDSRIKKELAAQLLGGISRFVTPPDDPQAGGGLLSGAMAMPNNNLKNALEKMIIDLGRIEKNFKADRIQNDEYPQEYQPYVEDYFRKLTREE